MPNREQPFSEADFVDLCDRVQWPLYSFVRGIVADDELARDLAQDTFLEMWRAAQRGASPFAAGHADAERRRWLFRVAYHRAVSALRHRHALRWHSLDELPGAQRAAMRTQPFEEDVAENQALRGALATLASADAACLLLIVVHGFTAAEVGQIVGASPAAVAKRFARAKQRLRSVYVAQNSQTPEGAHP